MSPAFTYTGLELEIFDKAHNWKKYIASEIQHYIRGSVAEVGAGTGNFTGFLQTDAVETWTFIEPDKRFRKILKGKMDRMELRSGKILESDNHLESTELFDTIIYMDVIEHIEDDKKEIRNVIRRLRPGGHVILLTPAFKFLYSPFDKEIGHFRRYSRPGLRNLFDARSNIIFCRYMDSAGFFSSLANRLFFKQKYPTQKQVKFWDSFLVPVSKLFDKIFFHSFGKSLIVVWQNGKEKK